MSKMKGSAVSLAQFLCDEAPYDCLDDIGRWAAGLGYKGVQLPGRDGGVIYIGQAAGSRTCCEEYQRNPAAMGLEATDISLDRRRSGRFPARVHAMSHSMTLPAVTTTTTAIAKSSAWAQRTH